MSEGFGRAGWAGRGDGGWGGSNMTTAESISQDRTGRFDGVASAFKVPKGDMMTEERLLQVSDLCRVLCI